MFSFIQGYVHLPFCFTCLYLFSKDFITPPNRLVSCPKGYTWGIGKVKNGRCQMLSFTTFFGDCDVPKS